MARSKCLIARLKSSSFDCAGDSVPIDMLHELEDRSCERKPPRTFIGCDLNANLISDRSRNFALQPQHIA